MERFVNRIKHYRRVATRYEKTAAQLLAFVHSVVPRNHGCDCQHGLVISSGGRGRDLTAYEGRRR